MKPFRRFYFDKFKFDKKTLSASFFYNFDEKDFFEEKINFKNDLFKLRKNLNTEVLNNFLFNIHLALWISYYKLYPTKELIIKSWYLDQNAIQFWKKFYKNWLSEFLYKNEISPKKMFNFMNISKDIYKKIDFKTSDKFLVPLWWWKDSIVSIELLKKHSIKFEAVVLWKLDEIKKGVLKKAKVDNFVIKRILSKRLFELNEQWYYNWHIPITWIIAFNLIFVAYLYDYKYIVLSNEKTADILNTVWKWLEINHQYSKSLEFEEDFSIYVKKYMSSELKYFSLLKWMYEYKISEIFSNLWQKYFKIFSSCNNNFKINKSITLKTKKKFFWCNNCSKCVFVYVMLSSFLEKKELLSIFWEDLYDREDLENLFNELLWISGIKPFECVWDKKEMILAMYNSIKLYKKSKIELPYILKLYKKEIFNKIWKNELNEIKKELKKIYNKELIPKEIKHLIKRL